jgi:hypothetical protein
MSEAKRIGHLGAQQGGRKVKKEKNVGGIPIIIKTRVELIKKRRLSRLSPMVTAFRSFLRAQKMLL